LLVSFKLKCVSMAKIKNLVFVVYCCALICLKFLEITIFVG